MKIIDCHAHLGWDINNIRKNLLPQEQSYQLLNEKMKTYKIEKAIVFPFPSPGAEFDKGFWFDEENEYILEAYNTFKKKLIPFFGVNPNDKKSVKLVKTESGLLPYIRGIKLLHPTQLKFSINKLIGHPLMKIVENNGLIFMIHIGTRKEPLSDKYKVTLDYAIKIAKKYPDIKFIFAHLGRLHWSLIEALNLNNVSIDTSGLSLWNRWEEFISLEPLPEFKNSSSIEVIEKLVDWGYEHKIVWGSDEPYTTYRNELDNILKAEISKTAKQSIFYTNIKRLLD